MPLPHIALSLATDAGLVTEHTPRTDSIAGQADRPWDYRDRHHIGTRPGQYDCVDQPVADWFLKQPAWLRLVSTNSLSKAGVHAAVAAGGFDVGSAVGSWKVTDRNANEIVFGNTMGFMEFWFSFHLPDDQPDTLEVATSVRYLWARTGAFYFALAKPMHRRFVRLLLKKTVT